MKEKSNGRRAERCPQCHKAMRQVGTNRRWRCCNPECTVVFVER